MAPGVSMQSGWSFEPRRGERAAWAWVIAILFATVASFSFAVDQSLTLSTLPDAPVSVNTP